MQAKTAGFPNLSTPAVEIICSLEKFDINLIAPASFLIIHFDKLQFLVANGKKPDVDVVIERLEFVGVLSFVETLKELIPQQDSCGLLRTQVRWRQWRPDVPSGDGT